MRLLYSLKNRVNYAFAISELNLTGDRQINLKIKQILNSYKNPNIKEERNFSLTLSSNSKKIITAKDASGNATRFKNEITVDVQVSLNEEYKSNFVITESFIYNTNSNTTELKNDENRIRDNLTETIVEKILLKLTKIL